MNYKIAEVCDIFIYCKVILEMWTIDSEKVFFYNYVENVKVKVIDVISTFSVFVVKRVENELILEHLWEQVIEVNIFN